MANTGIKQATVVYKVRAADTAPLDIDGNLTSISGKKQAIALLAGHSNPNAALYEVELYFNPGSFVYGVSTIVYSDDCPSGYLFVTPNRLVMQTDGANTVLTITSSHNWEFSTLPAFITVSAASGGRGISTVQVYPTITEGIGYATIKNIITGQEVRVFIIVSADLNAWILATGFWDNTAFWFNNGIWNY